MASKSLLFLLACSLLVFSAISSQHDEEILEESAVKTPTPSPPPVDGKPPLELPPPPPSKPSPPPPVKASPPPPVKASSPPPVNVPSPPRKTKKECTRLCQVRCMKHKRHKYCMRACITCCERCSCVPPGHYGNYDKCPPCYRNMTTRGGRRKCP